ncbi:MAG: two-component sensor histidine kinase [Slackia piriformis]|uniref:histidine kinase n=1 Tax=Slackia piriformis TaxID=626934 RepID=A0A943USC6_9ACTN|nr:two-component sensor histidine kinase [Slackia piriformis]
MAAPCSAPESAASETVGSHRGSGRMLSRTIARTVMAATAAVAAVCALLFALVFYFVVDQRAARDLEGECEAFAEVIDARSSDAASAVALLEGDAVVAPSDTRVTLIDEDGSVLYDNRADAALLENHALRPEVIQAMETGEGDSGRYSATLGEETLYHSIRLDEGPVVRLAVTQASVWGVLQSLALPYALLLAAAVLAAFLAAWAISRKIASEFSAVDLDRPLENDAPQEIVPLLERLDAQKKSIDAQAAERRRFTANVSHELKTPLTVISGYAELIDRGIARPEDVQKFAGLIHGEAQRMKTLVDELLTLSRLDDAQASAESAPVAMDQDVSLAQVAHATVSRLQPAAERRNVSLRARTPEQEGLSDIVVHGNARMLEEMTRNLVENAIRYNVEGGRVTVDVSRDRRGAPMLRVVDTGVGIPPELREKVFERFFCVDESRSKETGGTGLGLAIVKHAAQLHGAKVRVYGNDPRGSVFEVTFPA